ncbi:MAG: gliding motility-associated ABC transporter substrate-binding protein GldG [Flavobacteriaceae bacterium]|nr:gliding motility-associated ABC transporter substrate-binding protein GldG [Flavobacteriaceae bacterium]MCY4267516.1 gliding motility-associated ABC transporter substrate-binding protein GldG [Flavobacteriaceae bacterium]
MNRLTHVLWILSLCTLFLLVAFSLIDYRFDLTTDKRYSLSKSTIELIEKVEHPLTIDVLLSGKLPSSFLRLRSELNQLLELIQEKNNLISINVIEPKWLENSQNANLIFQNLGIQPYFVFEQKRNITNQITVYPWLVIHHETSSIPIYLLADGKSLTQQDLVIQSIELLEQTLVEGIYQASTKNKKNIAVLKSHDTSNDLYLTDWLLSLKNYYNIASFDFKAEDVTLDKTFENLKRFELLIISNPKQEFTVEEKFILDQFTCQGGRIIWLINPLDTNLQNLYQNENGYIPKIKQLALDDLFFKSQFRIQSQFVGDMYAAPIILASDMNESSQYTPFIYPYFPIITPNKNHPISIRINDVWQRFSSPIDTLKGKLKKTVLLASSAYSKLSGYPIILDLKTASQTPELESFNQKNIMTGILLEGSFESLYTNRIRPFDIEVFQNNGNSSWLVISDGHFGENQIEKNQPLALGYDKWTNNLYSNKSFLINSVHYLVGLHEILSLGQKKINLFQLDLAKIEKNERLIKVLMVFVPLIIVGVFWGLFQLLTKHPKKL